MKMPIIILATALSLTGAHAQVPGTTQSTQAQQQPCSNPSTPNKPATKTPSALTDPNSKIGKIFGKYSLVDPNTIFAPKAKPAGPCPPTAQPTAAIPAVTALKLPQDSSLVLRCNPAVAAKGATPTTFVLPDPNAFEMPGKSNGWEADTVVPDLSAKTPCYAFKVDPTNHKYFLPQ